MKTLQLMSNTIIWFMDTKGWYGEFKNQIIQAQVILRSVDGTVKFRLPKKITSKWVEWEPTDLGELYVLTEPVIAFSRLSHRSNAGFCEFLDHYKEIGIVGEEVEIRVLPRDYTRNCDDSGSDATEWKVEDSCMSWAEPPLTGAKVIIPHNDPSCIQYLEVFPETARSLVQYLGRRETRRIFTMCNQSSEFFSDQFVIVDKSRKTAQVIDMELQRDALNTPDNRNKLADQLVEMMSMADMMDELKDRISKDYETDDSQFVSDWKLAFGNFQN